MPGRARRRHRAGAAHRHRGGGPGDGVEAEATQTAAAVGPACAALTAAQIELACQMPAVPGRWSERADPARLRTALNTGYAPTSTRYTAAPAEYHHAAFRRCRRADTPLHRTLDVSGWIPPEITGTDHDRIAAHMSSRVGEHTRAALWCWAVPPWMACLTVPTPQGLTALGATTTGAPDLPDSDFGARLRPAPW
ncbi:hypothetical protein HBB16_09920 [Pseudonocardia sp. MCCB 268]|nr:hypothetical protein [Pseudonocardia cytotoxica]